MNTSMGVNDIAKAMADSQAVKDDLRPGRYGDPSETTNLFDGPDPDPNQYAREEMATSAEPMAERTDYSPDQPRDEQGRFALGDGGSGGAKAGAVGKGEGGAGGHDGGTGGDHGGAGGKSAEKSLKVSDHLVAAAHAAQAQGPSPEGGWQPNKSSAAHLQEAHEHAAKQKEHEEIAKANAAAGLHHAMLVQSHQTAAESHERQMKDDSHRASEAVNEAAAARSKGDHDRAAHFEAKAEEHKQSEAYNAKMAQSHLDLVDKHQTKADEHGKLAEEHKVLAEVHAKAHEKSNEAAQAAKGKEDAGVDAHPGAEAMHEKGEHGSEVGGHVGAFIDFLRNPLEGKEGEPAGGGEGGGGGEGAKEGKTGKGAGEGKGGAGKGHGEPHAPKATPAPHHDAAERHDFDPDQPRDDHGRFGSGSLGVDGKKGASSTSGVGRPGSTSHKGEGGMAKGGSLNELVEKVQARNAAIKEFTSKGDRVSGSGRDGPVAVTPDLNKPGIWRTTRFGADEQPTGHSEHPSYYEAVKSAVVDHGLKLPETGRDAHVAEVATQLQGVMSGHADGFSWRPDTQFATTGVMVGMHPSTGTSHIIEFDKATEKSIREDIRAYVEKHHDTIMKDPSLHFGGWKETDSAEKGGKSRFYLDVSKQFPKEQREEALALGRHNNQVAVFDIDNMTTIDTGGTGR